MKTTVYIAIFFIVLAILKENREELGNYLEGLSSADSSIQETYD